MTLARVQRVRERLGLDFTMPVITVAGTNGKGSTCAMLEAIALQAGYRVGLYSKPHLVHFEERCRVNGTMVEAAALLKDANFEGLDGGIWQNSLMFYGGLNGTAVWVQFLLVVWTTGWAAVLMALTFRWLARAMPRAYWLWKAAWGRVPWSKSMAS